MTPLPTHAPQRGQAMSETALTRTVMVANRAGLHARAAAMIAVAGAAASRPG